MVSYFCAFSVRVRAHVGKFISDISVLVAVVSPATDSLGSRIS